MSIAAPLAVATSVKSSDPTELRRERGRAIAAVTRITPKGDGWIVPSQKGQGAYRVTLDPSDPTVPMCTCPDFAERSQPCKHVFAVRYVIERESHPDGSETITETVTMTRQTTAKRPTYKQEWKVYDRAQTTEKRHFQALLADLCRGIAEPPRKPGPGRRPIPLADQVFAAVFKVYSTFSGRRFMSDLSDACDKGYIGRVPHFTTISGTLESPEITPILRSLIAESARPLASVEVDFAADSSGFTTCRFESWYDHKYGVVRRQHTWVKVHIMCGVKTNVVTAVEIRDKDAADPKQLPALARATRQTFTMREVSADKVYASLDNYDVLAECGAVPFIAFKSTHTGAGGGLFAKMFHYFNFNRDDFLSHYHKRSNVESTFSMMKVKFGDYVRSKTEVAQVNEALRKILGHNLCCLIQSVHELGITATFWGENESDTAQAPADATPAVGSNELIDMLAWM